MLEFSKSWRDFNGRGKRKKFYGFAQQDHEGHKDL